MLDDLRQIAIFAKTVDHGSFRGAAEALRLSPSVVSHHIKQLEERLGTALLYRSTRRLALTADGETLLASAHAMLEAAETGLRGISEQRAEPSGLLRLTLPAFLASSDLVERLSEFSTAHDKVELSVDFSDAVRDVIADGYDMAIRVGTLKDSALKAQKLCEIRRLLVGAPDYIDSQPTPTEPVDLADWRWLELAPVWHVKPEFKQPGRRKQVVKRETHISVNNAIALSRMARAGGGLTILPENVVAHDLASGGLQHLLPEWKTHSLNVYAVWPGNAPKGGLIKQLLQFLNAPENASRLIS